MKDAIEMAANLFFGVIAIIVGATIGGVLGWSIVATVMYLVH